jgi:metal-dependent amidase/aminoacylase/carboxypeptidase family protein
MNQLLAILFLFAPCSLFSPTSASPYLTRGKSTQEEEEQIAEAVIEFGEVREIRLPNTERKLRNGIVEAFFASEDQSEPLKEEIHELAIERTDSLVSMRRALHRHPELMYNEHDTSAYIQSALKAMDIPFTTGWAVNTVPDQIPGKGGYGVVADIGTGGPPCVLLRADMDALPILEKTEGVDDFKSTRDGKMHACGHDGHTTMLLGAASVLKGMEGSINGTVRLMFQPAEEGGAGAKRMVEEGVLSKEPQPQQAYAMHLWPTYVSVSKKIVFVLDLGLYIYTFNLSHTLFYDVRIPSGSIASRPGTILAAAERFEILIAGVGGHAAMPHLTVDPIVTASSVVMNLQTIVSRTLSPLESGVCSITKFEAGDAFNVIPAAALLRGTIRALSTETLLSLKDKVEHVVTTTAKVHGCNVTITYSPDFYPPTVNDPDLFHDFSKSVGALLSDSGEVMDIEPTMGAEDFGFVAEHIPSTFFLLGQGSGTDPPTNYGLHHPHFALDESVLPRGVEFHVNLALRALKKLGEDNGYATS